MDSVKGQPGGNAAMFWQKREGLIKMSAAGGTVITPFAVMEEQGLAHKRKVFDDGGTVVVNFVGKGLAVRAGKGSALQGEGQMDFSV